jgi:hypothetical protein
MRRPTCEGCRFYDAGAKFGICRRHAPRARILREHDGDLSGYPRWPEVEPDDWCGEHQDFPAWAKHESEEIKAIEEEVNATAKEQKASE